MFVSNKLTKGNVKLPPIWNVEFAEKNQEENPTFYFKILFFYVGKKKKIELPE